MDLTVVSYDGNGLNTADYTTYMPFEGGPLNLAPAEIREVNRLYRSPVLGSVSRTSRAITLWVRTAPVLSHSKRDSLMKIFDPYDISGGLKKLLVQDETAKQWYVMGYPREVNRTEEGYEVVLHVPDPEWIEETESPDTWNITASGQTKNITPAGNRPTYPTFEITPTSAKAGYSYKQLIIIRNVLERALSKYPIDITNGGWDTAALTTAKMQADGDDLRVRVDGKEVDRWLDGMDTASTKVWINLDLPARAQGTLRANIDSDDTQLDLKSIDGHFPKDGWLIAESEVIRHGSHKKVIISGKEYQRFTFLTRGAKGTTAATHNAGITVYRLPHVIEVVYGNASATAPDIEDEDKPAFNLSTSSNAIWGFDDFNDDDEVRAAGWREIVSGVLEKKQTIDAYTGTGGNNANPWTDLGLIVKKKNPPAPGDHHSFWEFRSPVGLLYVNALGRHKEDHASDHLYLRLRDNIPDGNWREVWERDLTNVTGSYWSWSEMSWVPRTKADRLQIGIYAVTEGDATGNCYVEVTRVTLVLDSSDIPYINFGLGGEQGSQYSLDCIISRRSPNEILTPSFEVDTNSDGLADNWLLKSGGEVVAMESTIVLHGCKSQKVTTDVPWEGIYQIGMVAPAGTTKVVAYAWVCRPAAGSDIRVDIYDNIVGAFRDIQLLSTGGWQIKVVGGYTWYRIVVSSSAIVAGNSHWLQIRSTTSTATVFYVDMAFWEWGTTTAPDNWIDYGAIEAINLEFVMDVGQTLTIDCGEKTVIYEKDDSYQYQAFSRDSVRSEWMLLTPDGGQLQFDETGLVAVTLVTRWRDRNS